MRVFVITGAGVSAESGIPTFRGKDGYWRNLDPAQLATPEAFARDPKLVWEWYRERRNRIWNAQPNAAHAAITRLAQHSDEFLLVTQNVDDLHARAGLPKEKMVQIHGDIFVTRCSRCDFGFTEHEPGIERFGVRGHVPALKAAIPRWRDRTPKCPKCDALVRPGVVWFGEQLPWNEVQRVESLSRWWSLRSRDCRRNHCNFRIYRRLGAAGQPRTLSGRTYRGESRRRHRSHDSQPSLCVSRLRSHCRASWIRSFVRSTARNMKAMVGTQRFNSALFYTPIQCR